MSVSVVVPVFNGEPSLRELTLMLGQVLPHVSTNYEVILVNDASPDRSWEIITELAKEFTWLRGIDLIRNYGQHNALLAGIRAATGDMIVTMDDDLQHPPEEIPALVRKLDECDLVYGIPQVKRHSFGRVIASRLMKLALTALGEPSPLRRSSYRAFRTCLRDAFSEYSSPFVSIDVLLDRAAPKIGAVTVQHSARSNGSSNYSIGKLTSLAFNIITGTSILPLQFAVLIGFGAAPLCLALLIAGQVQTPTREVFWGILVLLVGIQWLALWIVGEYLGRMHLNGLGRPPYLVRRKTTKNLI